MVTVITRTILAVLLAVLAGVWAALSYPSTDEHELPVPGSSLIQRRQHKVRTPEPREDSHVQYSNPEHVSLGLQQASNGSIFVTVIEQSTMFLKGCFDSIYVDHRTSLFFYLAGSCLLSIVLVWFIHDTLVQWWHRPRFRACSSKINHIHKVLSSTPTALPLCPVCLETMPKLPSRHVTVYLCGHTFHGECANRWLQGHPSKTSLCPICELPHAVSAVSASSTASAITNIDSTGTACPTENPTNEIKSFFLCSLRHKYPEIITEACVKRWSTCHAETWMAELKCPQYQSFFNPMLVDDPKSDMQKSS